MPPTTAPAIAPATWSVLLLTVTGRTLTIVPLSVWACDTVRGGAGVDAASDAGEGKGGDQDNSSHL